MSEPVYRAPGRFCYNCTYFDYPETQCRRNAPRPRYYAAFVRDGAYLREIGETDATYMTDAAPCWPVVDYRVWCGEWRIADVEPRDGWMLDGEHHPADDDGVAK